MRDTGTSGSKVAVGSAAILAAALTLSTLGHGGAWLGLGAIPVASLPPASGDIDFEIVTLPTDPVPAPEPVAPDPSVPSESDVVDDHGDDEDDEEIRERPRRRREARPPPRPERTPEPEPERTPEPEPTPAVPTPPMPEMPPPDQRRAITQHSPDPSVESPEDARFIADEAAVVEEETMAETRSLTEDAQEPRPASSEERAEAEDEGDADETEALETEDREGSDARRPTREEMAREEREPSDPSVSRRVSAETGREDADPSETPRRGSERVAAAGGARASSGGREAPRREVIIRDAFGSFVVPLEEAPAPRGSGGGTSGGDPREGEGTLARGPGRRGGRIGRRRGGDRIGALAGREEGTSLSLSWREFESIYGEEELRREREAAIEARRSRTRGGRSHAQRWDEFRAAIENYVPEVRPGRQTALSAARVPFASFLADMHRRIHPEFVGRFISGLPIDDRMGLADQSLSTLLEISINADGSIYRVGVVETSGNILFDFGAFDSVMRAQPFPVPPRSILSGDGRAWLHWRFDRNPRHCHTWNARPFMLDNGPDVVDRGEPEDPDLEEPDQPILRPESDEGS